MKYTSAEAAKLLRKLNEEQAALKERESKTATFVAAVDEDVASARPEYDYAGTQKLLAQLEEKVRKVKHALNAFNLQTTVPGFEMTVDQMLVYIPQLSEKKRRLANLANKLPKQRVVGGYNASKSIIEYTYANCDVAEATADLNAVVDELARAQTALDVVNNTETFEIDV